MIDLYAVKSVWMRYFLVFRRNIVHGLVTTFVEPILYLVSFGFGMGGLIGEVTTGGVTVPYRQFIFAGIMAQTIMFQGFFEAAYGSFVRMYYQKIFQSMGVTPITLSEILWGELLWDATRAAIPVTAICIICTLSGDFRSLTVFLAIPLGFLCAFIVAGMGMLTSAKARSIEDISYPQFLFIFPMFLFCGVYFPLEQLPPTFRTLAWLLPLTPVASLLRTLTIGLPFHPAAPFAIVFWLLMIVPYARRAMKQRLVK